MICHDTWGAWPAPPGFPHPAAQLVNQQKATIEIPIGSKQSSRGASPINQAQKQKPNRRKLTHPKIPPITLIIRMEMIELGLGILLGIISSDKMCHTYGKSSFNVHLYRIN